MNSALPLTRRPFPWILGFLLAEALLILFLDRPIAALLHATDQNHPRIINFFRFYTDTGKSGIYLILAAIGVILCLTLRRMAPVKAITERVRYIGSFLLFFLIALALSGIFADILKWMIGRSRPIEWNESGIYTLHPFATNARFQSFPSGHATTAFMIALILDHLLPRSRVPVFLLAIAVALSRVMVNAHFASDAVAGFGIAYLTLAFLKWPPVAGKLESLRAILFGDHRTSL